MRRPTTAAAVDFSGSAMVALYPRELEARSLALEGEQPAEGLHVTLLYLGDARDAIPMLELVQAVAGGCASETEALVGEVGGVATFEDNGEGAPLVLLPDVPGLTEFGTHLREALARIGVDSASEHGFQPHLTLSYGAEPASAEDRIGQPLHFDAISVVIGNDRFDYPLQSPPQTLLSDANRPCVPLPSGGPMRENSALQDLAVRALGADRERRLAMLSALTAAGIEDAVEPTTTYELTQGSLAERKFYSEVVAAGYAETRRAAWPSDAELEDHGEVLFRDGDVGVFRLGDVIVLAHCGEGWFSTRIASSSRSDVASVIDSFAQIYPPLYARDDDSTVPITFWSDSKYGPVSRLRRIEASSWETIGRNYSGAVKDELARLVENFEPGADGQLLLWQGPPGTGKTWALRALAAEWSDWAEFHYITDPDAFFVTNPSYLIDVLLSDTYEELTPDNDVLTSANVEGKWKVLILEDTGELLSANAKEAYGQGLSRLLNVVDGMVGQGLRVLALLTTNDELGDLHPAAVRPGRCASQIVFDALSADEASAWLGETVDEGGTLAELYARRGDAEPAFEQAVTAAAASQLRWESVLMLEGEPTDDGRMIEEGAIDWRELPLTLMAQFETAEGHQRAVVAGRIDEIWRDGHRIMGRGVFDTGEDGQECARMVGDKMLRGVSVDLAIRKFELRPKDSPEDITDEQALLDLLMGGADMLYVVTDGSIGAATVCAFPAFADAEIALVASAPELVWRSTCEHDMTISELEPTLTASAAGLAPVVPPAEWFENPGLEEPTPLQVTDDGRIFGHAAVWETCHIGLENACVMAPHSQTDYAYFLLGEIEVETDEGRARIPCGTLTLGTGHAGLKLTRERAVEHYDDSGTAAAHLAAGEDEHGIWVAGAMSPDLSEERARELRGSKISGDWRRVNGNLELVAMLAVNVPGFPVPRLSATASGEGESLIAAGVADKRVLDAMRDRREIDDLAAEAIGLEDLAARAAEETPEGEPFHGTLVEAALATLAVAHTRTVEAVEKITSAGPGEDERGKRELALAQKSLEIVERFASRGHAPVPDVHVDVHVPEREVTVESPAVTVHVPEQPAPVVELTNEVHVPEQPAPQVVVAAAPAPEVRIEPAPPRSVRVTEDPETGERVYVQE